MRKNKPVNGYFKIGFGKPSRTILYANRPVNEQLFAAIKYYSEVKDVGKEFIKGFGHANHREVWLLFQSFIRQAETFYESANQLNYRAAALMYYYSFLNLAKGLICLSDPKIVTQPIGHGIRHKFEKSRFSSQYITTDQNGVFPRFYELITNRKIPPRTKLTITKLLGYSSDIAHEYSIGKFGPRKTSTACVRVLAETNKKESWLAIAVMYPEATKLITKQKLFSSYFEQVEFSKETAREVFEIPHEAFRHYTYFESKKIYPWIDNKIQIPSIVQDAQIALQSFQEPNPYDDNHILLLNSPLTNINRTQIAMNQTIAIYTTMYYLGSLVRYRPDYLEYLLNSKNAWIIERFTKSAPLTFLRSITNYILGTEYIFVSR